VSTICAYATQVTCAVTIGADVRVLLIAQMFIVCCCPLYIVDVRRCADGTASDLRRCADVCMDIDDCADIYFLLLLLYLLLHGCAPSVDMFICCGDEYLVCLIVEIVPMDVK